MLLSGHARNPRLQRLTSFLQHHRFLVPEQGTDTIGDIVRVEVKENCIVAEIEVDTASSSRKFVGQLQMRQIGKLHPNYVVLC